MTENDSYFQVFNNLGKRQEYIYKEIFSFGFNFFFFVLILLAKAKTILDTILDYF